MNPNDIILQQMERLNMVKTSDPDQACRIAEAICKLAEQIIRNQEPQTPGAAESQSDSLSSKEACLFLKMGETTLNREIASDPNFPIYQPAGPKGRRYFSRAKLSERKASRIGEINKSEKAQGKTYRVD